MNSTQQGTNTQKSPAQAHVVALARKFDTAFLVTRGQNGGLHARPMGIADVEGDAKLWFATQEGSLKVDELRANPEVLVLMQDGRRRSLSLTGRGRVVKDAERARALWTPALKLWFSGPDDPSLALLEVDPTSAEYWDAGGAQGVRLAVTALKRYFAGEELTDADMEQTHERVSL